MSKAVGVSAEADGLGEPVAKPATSLRSRAILSCCIGNFFELFDFTIYGYFAVAIARAFYPHGSMFGTYAAFGAAFLMRPVGALVLGSYGDRHGRRAALAITIGIMAAATGITGLIPPYAVIGFWAPVLLVVCRLLQGFSTGGEWGGAAAFLVEYAPPDRRGLNGSWQQFSIQIGSVCGSLSAAVLASSLSRHEFYAWGWRVPFILGSLLGPIGYYLRTRVAETPSFERATRRAGIEHSPIATALREFRWRMLQGFGVSAVGCIANFTFVIYLVGYAINALNLPPGSALSCAVVSGLIVVVCTPFVGLLSDRIGRKPLILACALLHLTLDYPLFLLAVKGGSVRWLLLVLACHGLIQSLSAGTVPTALAELFPTRVRYTALSVSYGFAVVLFGGFAPLISMWLVRTTGSPLSPAFYIMIGGLLTALAAISLKDRRGLPLE